MYLKEIWGYPVKSMAGSLVGAPQCVRACFGHSRPLAAFTWRRRWDCRRSLPVCRFRIYSRGSCGGCGRVGRRGRIVAVDGKNLDARIVGALVIAMPHLIDKHTRCGQHESSG